MLAFSPPNHTGWLLPLDCVVKLSRSALTWWRNRQYSSIRDTVRELYQILTSLLMTSFGSNSITSSSVSSHAFATSATQHETTMRSTHEDTEQKRQLHPDPFDALRSSPKWDRVASLLVLWPRAVPPGTHGLRSKVNGEGKQD